MSIAAENLVRRNPTVLFTDLGTEVILMDAQAGLYFNAKQVGASIWALLETPQTLREICEALQTKYQIDTETCARETAQFVTKLQEAQLVTIE
ncbi:MAG: PqqD family peptide modification chaperone [Pseudomonadota bacterium]